MTTNLTKILVAAITTLALLPAIVDAGLLDGELPVEKVDTSIVGIWEHMSNDRETEGGEPSLTSRFEVRPNQAFSLRRSVRPNHTSTYMGVITKKDGKIVAETVLGPVVCPGGDRSWTVSLNGDVLTLQFGPDRVEQYRRIAEPKKDAEQGVAPQSATRSESEPEGGDKPQPESKPRPR